MSARLYVRPWVQAGQLFVVECSHGVASQVVEAVLFRSARFDAYQFTTRTLEARLHRETGCACTVPREGEMATTEGGG